MRKIKLGFSEYSADELEDVANAALEAIPEILIFASVTPSIASLRALVDDVAQKKMEKGPGAHTALRASMKTLADGFSLFATNLNNTPNVTETDLEETTLPMEKERTRTTQVPTQLLDVRLKHGTMPGVVEGKCKVSEDNVRWIVAEWTLDPNSGPWTPAGSFTNSQKMTIPGLPRGKDVWIRFAAVNVIGQGAWSDPATIMAI
jgi:hypothetical protein